MNWQKDTIDEVMAKFRKSLPNDLPSLSEGADDLLRSALESALARMDVVPREEFDVQKQVLQRTRQRLEHIEQRIQQLEQDTNEVK